MESTPEQTEEGLVIVRVLAAVLDRLIYTNVMLSPNEMNDPAIIVTKFHAMKPPGISIQQYLERYVDVMIETFDDATYITNHLRLYVYIIVFIDMHPVRMSLSF